MRLQQLFEKFELFADAPGAVVKMRELVLRLAFTGGLSGNTLKDGEGTPLGWEKRTIASICSSITPGFACSRSHQAKDGHVHLRTHNVSTLGNLNFDLLVRIDKKMVDPQKSFLHRGDILFNNTNSQELVGKTALVDRDYDYGFSNHITRLRLKEGIHPGFVVFYFTMLRNSGYFAKLCTRWINQAAVNTETLKVQPIPLPSLPEQKHIAAKVDELMALCDRLEAQQNERNSRHAALVRASLARFAETPTSANLELLFHKAYVISPADLRKAILSLAVQGKLVPQNPNDVDPESRLLEIHRLRVKLGKTGKLRMAKVPEGAFLQEPLAFIPSGWRTVTFDHLAMPQNNALKAGPFGSALKKEFYVQKGYKIYGQEQVIAGDPFLGDYYIDKMKFAELESCAVSPGDILISLVGTIGKLLVLPEGIEPGIINPRVIKLSLDPKLVLPSFIKVLISSSYSVNFFEENSHGGTMNILNLSILRALPVPLPSLAEQRRIVAKVDELMALVDQLEAQLAAARTTSTALLDALVAELTAQA